MYDKVKNEMPYHLFVAAIGDIEHGHGLCLTIDGKIVRAKLVTITKSFEGQPAAFYKVPGKRGYLVVGIDPFTLTPHCLKWIEPENDDGKPPATPLAA